jgi:acetate kinase
VDLFVFRAVREIGALAASLSGIDGLVFTAGIGQHASEIRGRICARCAWLGVILDERANSNGEVRITSEASADRMAVSTPRASVIPSAALPRQDNHNSRIASDLPTQKFIGPVKRTRSG